MMKKLIYITGCFALLNASAALTVYGAQADNMTAAQIVEKNVKARGGLEAWRSVSSMTMSGELNAGGQKNTMLPFVMSMKRPYKSRLEIRFQDQPALQVYDGTQGWKVRPFLGRDEVEPFSLAETKAAKGWQELDGPLINYMAKGTKVELQGTETVEGKNTYKLKLTMKNGEQRNLWVDATSFLEVKIDGDPRKMDGKLRNVAVYYRDFKKVNGLTVPYLTETVVDGISQTHKMNIQTVTLNPPLDDTIFAKPKLNLATATDR
jgi:outer membrane lipoprotein-sorting protein